MFWLHRLNPANKFREFFELKHANTPQLQHEVYHLRHRVFCEEMGFWRPTFSSLEHDEYDERSRHLLLRSVKTGASVGSVRLVLVPQEQPGLLLPFEKICAATLYRHEIDPAKLPRGRIAEVSRLCLAREFRGRRRKTASGQVARQSFGTPAHPTYPYVQLGLYLGAIALAEQMGIATLFMLTEHWLLSHFKRLGFPVRQIGDPVDYRGLCVPSMGQVVDPQTQLSYFMRPLYRVITHQLAEPRAVVPGHHHPVPLPARLTPQNAPGRAVARPLPRRSTGTHGDLPFAGFPLDAVSRHTH